VAARRRRNGGAVQSPDTARAIELWKLDPDKPNPTTV
jgi:hypothetical protein